MNLLLISATESEIKPTLDHLDSHWTKKSFTEYQKNDTHLFPLITGIGSMMTAFSIARTKNIASISLVLHAGIAGSYSNHISPGEIVEVISEQSGDLGAEDSNGQFISSFELKLQDPNRFPYQNGRIFKTRQTIETGIRKVDGLTVNKASGSASRIQNLINLFSADIESMEGLGLFYACRVMDIPFISLRGISNYVEPRNKENWMIKEAVTNMNDYLIQEIEKMAI